MAVLYHTNGTTPIYIGSGTGGSQLGISGVEGVEIAISAGNVEQFSDEYGPFMPAEVLQLGGRARITCELWKYDTTVLNNLMALRMGSLSAGGVNTTLGQLMFTAGKFFGITLPSVNDGQPWYFPTCQLAAEPMAVNLSTTMKIWRISINAYKWSASGSLSEGAYLYSNNV